MGQWEMGCHIKLTVKAHLNLGQPHMYTNSGMVVCEERDGESIWTSPPMARPIIEISKTSTHTPGTHMDSEMR